MSALTLQEIIDRIKARSDEGRPPRKRIQSRVRYPEFYIRRIARFLARVEARIEIERACLGDPQ